MTRLISYPFRLAPSGVVATEEDGTPECYAQELAVLVMTRPGERDLVPDFGIEDPVYYQPEFNSAELRAKVNLFGPPVRITAVNTAYPSDGFEQVQITFEPLSEDADYPASNGTEITDAFA